VPPLPPELEDPPLPPEPPVALDPAVPLDPPPPVDPPLPVVLLTEPEPPDDPLSVDPLLPVENDPPDPASPPARVEAPIIDAGSSSPCAHPTTRSALAAGRAHGRARKLKTNIDSAVLVGCSPTAHNAWTGRIDHR